MTARVSDLSWTTALSPAATPGLLHPQSFVVLSTAWRTTTGATLSALTSSGLTWARLGGSNVASGLCVDLWIGYGATSDASVAAPTATWAGGTATSAASVALICSGPDPVTALPTVGVSAAARLDSNAALTVPEITPPANALYVAAYAMAGTSAAATYVSDPPNTITSLAVSAGASQAARVLVRQVCTAVPHSVTATPPAAATLQAGLAVTIALPDAVPLATVRLYKGRRTAVLDQAGVS